jgi:hypothetical protein
MRGQLQIVEPPRGRWTLNHQFMSDRRIPLSSDSAVDSSRAAAGHRALADWHSIHRNGESDRPCGGAFNSSDERERRLQFLHAREGSGVGAYDTGGRSSGRLKYLHPQSINGDEDMRRQCKSSEAGQDCRTEQAITSPILHGCICRLLLTDTSARRGQDSQVNYHWVSVVVESLVTLPIVELSSGCPTIGSSAFGSTS